MCQTRMSSSLQAVMTRGKDSSSSSYCDCEDEIVVGRARTSRTQSGWGRGVRGCRKEVERGRRREVVSLEVV